MSVMGLRIWSWVIFFVGVGVESSGTDIVFGSGLWCASVAWH